MTCGTQFSRLLALLSFVGASGCGLTLDVDGLGEGCPPDSEAQAGSCVSLLSEAKDRSCKDGEFSAEGGCHPISDCELGQRVLQAPSPTQDRLCEPCPSDQFSDSVNASNCTPYTVCTAGQHVLRQASLTEDRLCEPCPSGQFSDSVNALVCTPFTLCTADEFQSLKPTAERDRICEPITQCGPGEYEVSGPTETMDRVCAACPDGTFSTTQNASDCTNWSRCAAGYAESRAPTQVSDRVCIACDPEFFEVADECQPVSVCPPGTFVALAATLTSDKVCSPCPARTFSDTRDATQCRPWQECAETMGASRDPLDAPTAMRDRVCLPCEADEYASGGQCLSVSDCLESEYETVAPTTTTDRECGACVPDVMIAGERICSPRGYLKNYWASSWYLTVHEGAPTVKLLGEDGETAQWSFERVGHYYRIRNRYDPDQYLHTESGTLEAGPIMPDWLSAQWVLTDVSSQVYPVPGFPIYRIANRADTDKLLHVEHGWLEWGPIGEGWMSSVWEVPDLLSDG